MVSFRRRAVGFAGRAGRRLQLHIQWGGVISPVISDSFGQTQPGIQSVELCQRLSSRGFATGLCIRQSEKGSREEIDAIIYKELTCLLFINLSSDWTNNR